MAETQPKSMQRAKTWSKEVEEAYRFQVAGYRDEEEYLAINKASAVDRWTDGNAFVKKLKRKDGYFYYYDKARECTDKDLWKVKMYLY